MWGMTINLMFYKINGAMWNKGKKIHSRSMIPPSPPREFKSSVLENIICH